MLRGKPYDDVDVAHRKFVPGVQEDSWAKRHGTPCQKCPGLAGAQQPTARPSIRCAARCDKMQAGPAQRSAESSSNRRTPSCPSDAQTALYDRPACAAHAVGTPERRHFAALPVQLLLEVVKLLIRQDGLLVVVVGLQGGSKAVDKLHLRQHRVGPPKTEQVVAPLLPSMLSKLARVVVATFHSTCT